MAAGWVHPARNTVRRRQQLLAATRASLRTHARATLKRTRAARARRNPLHGICGALELCRAPSVAPGEIRELLHDMQEGVDLMCAITNDLLDLEKLRSGKFVVRPTPVPLRALVDNVADAARPACTGTLSVVIDPGVPPTLLVDGLRLRQVLANGLSNACKHGKNVTLSITVAAAAAAAAASEGSLAVAAAAAAAPRRVLMRVLDDGPGLGGMDPTKLFDDFSAAAHTVGVRGKGVMGSGLGLPICARLAVIMGGALAVRDRADGATGAEFALTLPCVVPPPAEALPAAPGPVAADAAAAAAAAAAPGSTITVVVAPAPQQEPQFDRRSSATVAPLPPLSEHAATMLRLDPHSGSAASLRRPRIVVVDDAPLNRRIAERYVHALGLDCLLLADGDEVAAAVAGGRCDLILMDIRMARMDGDVACRQLRAGGFTGPIIAVSGLAMRACDCVSVRLRV